MDTLGIFVIAVCGATLFALGSAQIGYRLGRASTFPLGQVAILPELEAVPLRIVAPAGALIAVASQVPVVYLLAFGDLPPGAVALLCAELLAVAGWLADLAGAAERLRPLVTTARARATALRLSKVGQHSS